MSFDDAVALALKPVPDIQYIAANQAGTRPEHPDAM